MAYILVNDSGHDCDICDHLGKMLVLPAGVMYPVPDLEREEDIEYYEQLKDLGLHIVETEVPEMETPATTPSVLDPEVGKEMDELVNEDYSVEQSGQTITVHGTVIRQDDWDYLPSSLNHTWVIPIQFDDTGWIASENLVVKDAMVMAVSSPNVVIKENPKEKKAEIPGTLLFYIPNEETYSITARYLEEEDSTDGQVLFIDLNDVKYTHSGEPEPPVLEKPTLSSESELVAESVNPKVVLVSDHVFKEALTSEDFDIDFGETNLTFGSATGGSESATIVFDGTAAEGVVALSALPSAFEPSENLEQTDTVSITVNPAATKVSPTLVTSTRIYVGDESPDIVLTSDRDFIESPTEENLGLDFGSTGLSFASASAEGSVCTVSTSGSAVAGEITAQAAPEAFGDSANLNESAQVKIVVSDRVKPSLSANEQDWYEGSTPTVRLTSDHVFKDSLTEDDLGLDLGETGLSFRRALGSDTTCTVTFTEKAKAGVIKFKVKPSAFKDPEGLAETDEISVEVKALVRPTLGFKSGNVFIGDDSPKIELVSDKTFAQSPTQAQLGLDFGTTNLAFKSAVGGSNTVSVTTTGVAAEGQIKARAKALAFSPNKGYGETDEAVLNVQKRLEASDLVSLTPLSSAQLGKNPDDIQSGLSVVMDGMTYKVSGTSKWIQSWDEFEKGAKGNFVGFSVKPTDKAISITGIGVEEKPVNDDWLILKVTSPQNVYTLRVNTTEGNRDVKVDFSGLELELKPDEVADFFEVAPAEGEQWGKQVDDIQSGVQIETAAMTAALSGTLHYVNSWPAFSKTAKGNFIALKFDAKPGVKTLRFIGDQSVDIPSGEVLILNLRGKDSTFTVRAVDGRGNHDVTFSCTGLTFEPKPDEVGDFVVLTPYTSEVYGKNPTELQSGVEISTDGMNAEISGNLYYVEEYHDFNPSNADEQSGNYLALGIAKRGGVNSIDFKNYKGDITHLNDDDYLVIRFSGKNNFEIVAKTDGGDKTISVDCSGLVLEPKPNPVLLKVAEGEIYSKPVEQFGSISVDGNEITGSVKFQEHVDGFEGEKQSGYYLTLDSDDYSGNYFRVKWIGSEPSEWMALDDQKLLIWCGADGKKVEWVETRRGEDGTVSRYTVNVTAVPKPEPIVISAKMADRGHSWKGVTYSDLYTEDTSAELGGDTITVSGTLLQKKGWEGVSVANRDKWYPVIEFTAPVGTVTKSTGIDGETVSTYTFEKATDDFVVTVDEGHKTKVITFYKDAGDAASETNGRSVTIDCTGCTFLEDAPVSLTVAVAEQGHSWKGVKYSECQSEDTTVNVEGNSIVVNGKLFKVNDWEAFGESNQDKYYICANVTRPQGSYLMGADGRHMLASKLTDDIVQVVSNGQSKPTYTLYPSTKHKEADFAGTKYTFDLSAVEFVDPYVTVTVNDGFTYNVPDVSVFGDFEVNGTTVSGTAKKQANVDDGSGNPARQSGYFTSLVVEPWEGFSVKAGGDWANLSGNGKVLVRIGDGEDNIDGFDIRNNKAPNRITHISFDITCTPDDSIPTVKEMGYKATKAEFDEYLSSIGSEDKRNVGDQIFYIRFTRPLDAVTDYMTVVDVLDHKYAVLSAHTPEEETIRYFSLKDGGQVDFVDGAKKDGNGAVDVSSAENATVQFYKLTGAANGEVYPSDAVLVAHMVVSLNQE